MPMQHALHPITHMDCLAYPVRGMAARGQYFVYW
jgi:hypothetical protein